MVSKAERKMQGALGTFSKYNVSFFYVTKVHRKVVDRLQRCVYAKNGRDAVTTAWDNIPLTTLYKTRFYNCICAQIDCVTPFSEIEVYTHVGGPYQIDLYHETGIAPWEHGLPSWTYESNYKLKRNFKK